MGKPIEACHISVGIRIRMIREMLGLTQDDLAMTWYTLLLNLLIAGL